MYVLYICDVNIFIEQLLKIKTNITKLVYTLEFKL